NGTVLGVYSHVESIKEGFLKRNFGSADGNLYEGGRSDFRSDWFQNFVIKKSSLATPRADLEATTKAIESAQGSLMAVLERSLDLEEFFRFWAVESLINDADGYAANANNFYVYHDPRRDRFSFIPWGADTVMFSGGGRGPTGG